MALDYISVIPCFGFSSSYDTNGKYHYSVGCSTNLNA